MVDATDTPPDAGTGLHDRLLSAAEADRTWRQGPPPFKPGSPAWLAGYEHAKRQAADMLEAYAAESLARGYNDRFQCAKNHSHTIRSMKPEAPR